MERATQSIQLTESGIVTTANAAGILYGITLLSGTTDSKILIENGGSGGTAKWALSLDGTVAAGETCTSISFNPGIICSTDIYGTLTGTGAIAYVAYEQIE